MKQTNPKSNWLKDNVTVALDTTTLTLGVVATVITNTAANTEHRMYQALIGSNQLAAHKVVARAGTANFMSLSNGSNTMYATFNLSVGTVVANVGCTGVITQDVGANFYNCYITNPTSNSTYIMVHVGETQAQAVPQVLYVGTGKTILVGKMNSTNGSMPYANYQKTTTANTYDTAGFPLYLAGNGTNSNMSFPLNLSGTSQATIWAGVTKNSDAAAGVLVELTADSTANNGGFAITTPNSAAGNYGFLTRGTVAGSNRVASTYTAPISKVLSVALDNTAGTIAGQIAPRVNGAIPTTVDSAITTTGAFANGTGFLFARGGTTLFANDKLYGLIVRGAQSSAAQILQGKARLMRTRRREGCTKCGYAAA